MATILGQRLGPYEILAAIGAGGMGEVYRARDTRLDRIVAIKVLPERASDRNGLRTVEQLGGGGIGVVYKAEDAKAPSVCRAQFLAGGIRWQGRYA